MYHFVREQVELGTVAFQYIGTRDMAADVLTKALPRPKHVADLSLLGLHGA